MRFAVRFLRHRGRMIPLRMVANQPVKIGDLRIEECRDEELHRYVRMAKLFADDTSRYSADLPQLLDVRLISMSPQAFTLAGFERISNAWSTGSHGLSHANVATDEGLRARRRC
jgi:hypothetical protein